MAQNEYAFIKTGTNEYIKQYLVYDGSGRMTAVYESRANARHGEPCLKTTYEYSGVTSRVIKMLEEQTSWDSSWDM